MRSQQQPPCYILDSDSISLYIKIISLPNAIFLLWYDLKPHGMIDMQSSYPFMQSDTFCFSFLIVFDNVRYMQIITRWNSFAWMHTTCIRIASDLRQRANMKLGYCWSVSQSSPPTHLLAVHRTLKKPVLCEQSDSVTIDHPVRKLVSFIGWFKVKARLARSINAHVMWSCDPWHKKYLIWIMEIPKKEATIPTATTNDVKLQSPKHFYMLSSINDSLSLFLLLLSALGTSLLLLYHLVSKIKIINSHHDNDVLSNNWPKLVHVLW